MATLRLRDQKERWLFDIAPGTTAVVGRGDQADLRVGDVSVARRHARLFEQDGHWCIEDLGSHCGVFVNQVLARGTQPIGAGDRVRIGAVEFLVEEGLVDVETTIQRAHASRSAGRLPEARALYRAAADACAREGRRVKAVALMRKALAVGPADAETLWHAAEVACNLPMAVQWWEDAARELEREGQTERAREALRKAKEIGGTYWR